MRLLSGRARETEIKLSEGFQSGPEADSDLDSTSAKGVKEGGRSGPGQPHAHLLCRLPNAATA